ncbi:riboflavin kinase [Radiobacillus sp. PE A8.2]|uniref:riboflavin kinase n=1 Tax=Radiobacillus sp. PE A8.2 TaxID=3380349 RepID=UPI0038903839
MEIIHVTDKLAADTALLTLVVGEFDGVHKGHEVLLQTARNKTDQAHEKLAAVIFSRNENKLISDQDKLNRLKQYGVDRVYLFDSKTTEAFMLEQVASLNIKRVVIGEKQSANTKSLIDFCKQMNIDIIEISSVTENGKAISTSGIRKLIGEGFMEPVHVLLGRPFTLTGTVIHGEKVGRQLGFPTINLGGVDDFVQPKPGVYLGVAGIHEDDVITAYWHVLISAGYRPTVNGKGYLVEAHLLNFSGDLYGKTVSVSFLRYMRGEIKFTDLNALVQQMDQDKLDAQKLIGM